MEIRQHRGTVTFELAGETVARTDRAAVVDEAGYPPRYYFPPEDVRKELLTASDTRTVCPRKGVASYYHLSCGDARHRDAAWCYHQPMGSAQELAGMIAFYTEDGGLRVEGEGSGGP